MAELSSIETPLISVVIPTYNRGDDVVKAVRSMGQQTYKNIEILVVVDGAKDDTVAQLKKLQESEPRLKIIEQENRGVSAARNNGIGQAKGQYVALMDDDDIASPRRLERQIERLRSLPEDKPTLCVSDVDYVEKDGSRRLLTYPEPITAQHIYRNNHFFPPTSWMASKETFAKAGVFDTQMRSAEDFDWLLRFAKNGGEFTNVKEPLVTYFAPERGKIYAGHAESIQTLINRYNDVLSPEAVNSLSREVARAQRAAEPVQKPTPGRPSRTGDNAAAAIARAKPA